MAMAAALLSGGTLCSKTNAADAGARPYRERAQWLQLAKEKLGLTEDQVEKIKAELVAEKDTLKALVTNLHEAHIAVREAIQAPGANETTVRAAAAKAGSAEADLAVERLKLYGRISPILRAEQLDKLKQMRSRLDDLIDRAIDRAGQRLTSQ